MSWKHQKLFSLLTLGVAFLINCVPAAPQGARVAAEGKRFHEVAYTIPGRR